MLPLRDTRLPVETVHNHWKSVTFFTEPLNTQLSVAVVRPLPLAASCFLIYSPRSLAACKFLHETLFGGPKLLGLPRQLAGSPLISFSFLLIPQLSHKAPDAYFLCFGGPEFISCPLAVIWSLLACSFALSLLQSPPVGSLQSCHEIVSGVPNFLGFPTHLIVLIPFAYFSQRTEFTFPHFPGCYQPNVFLSGQFDLMLPLRYTRLLARETRGSTPSLKLPIPAILILRLCWTSFFHLLELSLFSSLICLSSIEN